MPGWSRYRYHQLELERKLNRGAVTVKLAAVTTGTQGWVSSLPGSSSRAGGSTTDLAASTSPGQGLTANLQLDSMIMMYSEPHLTRAAPGRRHGCSRLQVRAAAALAAARALGRTVGRASAQLRLH